VARIFLGRNLQVDTVKMLRRGATALAVGRMGLGVVALTSPALVARPWVGPSGDSQAGSVLGRALGGRDLVLGLGTLAALRRSPGAETAQAAAAWVALSGVADGFDLLITVGSWRELPGRERWLVASAAGGAAALSLATAAFLSPATAASARAAAGVTR
jgi:hypothetical protein